MPWFNELDPDEPVDIESAAEGAERIREFKRAIVERLSTVFRGFPGEDPSRPGEPLLFPIAGGEVGTESQRPSAPAREGHFWFSTDTKTLYIADRDRVWRALIIGTQDLESVGRPRIKLINTSVPQEIPRTEFTPLEYANADIVFERGIGWFDSEESPTDFIVPASGPYQIMVSGRMVKQVGSIKGAVYVHRNGTSIASSSIRQPSTNGTHFHVVTIAELTEGDVIRGVVWHDDDNPMFINAVLNEENRMEIYAIADLFDDEDYGPYPV